MKGNIVKLSLQCNNKLSDGIFLFFLQYFVNGDPVEESISSSYFGLRMDIFPT